MLGGTCLQALVFILIVKLIIVLICGLVKITLKPGNPRMLWLLLFVMAIVVPYKNFNIDLCILLVKYYVLC